jgi:hypothetical protein
VRGRYRARFHAALPHDGRSGRDGNASATPASGATDEAEAGDHHGPGGRFGHSACTDGDRLHDLLVDAAQDLHLAVARQPHVMKLRGASDHRSVVARDRGAEDLPDRDLGCLPIEIGRRSQAEVDQAADLLQVGQRDDVAVEVVRKQVVLEVQRRVLVAQKDVVEQIDAEAQPFQVGAVGQIEHPRPDIAVDAVRHCHMDSDGIRHGDVGHLDIGGRRGRHGEHHRQSCHEKTEFFQEHIFHPSIPLLGMVGEFGHCQKQAEATPYHRDFL